MEKEDWGFRTEYKWCIQAKRRPNGVRSMLKDFYRETCREDRLIPECAVLQVCATPQTQGDGRQPTAALKAVTEFQQNTIHLIKLFIFIFWVLRFSSLHLSNPFIWGL